MKRNMSFLFKLREIDKNQNARLASEGPSRAIKIAKLKFQGPKDLILT